MMLFTAFAPLTLHEKMTEIWIQVFNTQNAPVAAMYLSTLDVAKNEIYVDPNKKNRRGALRVGKVNRGRRKHLSVGELREIDLSTLDLTVIKEAMGIDADELAVATAKAADNVLSKVPHAAEKTASCFNQRASQIVCKHLAVCAVKSASVKPLTSWKRRDTAIALLEKQDALRDKIARFSQTKVEVPGKALDSVLPADFL